MLYTINHLDTREVLETQSEVLEQIKIKYKIWICLFFYHKGNSVRRETNGPKFQNHPIST